MSGARARHAQTLRRLARLYGVQTGYVDITGTRRAASVEALEAVLAALGASVEGDGDAQAALRAYQREWWERGLDPVTVAWDGGPPTLRVRLPAKDRAPAVSVELEHGESVRWPAHPRPLAWRRIDGRRYLLADLTLPQRLPPGYHTLSVESGRRRYQTLVISAPRRAFAGAPERRWGLFIPTYALRGAADWGAGDLGDLAALQRWSAGLGARLTAALPMLAAFLDEPCEPSPYAPVSRLFWNEFYVDIEQLPDLASCAPARALLQRRAVREQLRRLRAQDLVDYRRTMALKRLILGALAEAFFADAPPRRKEALARYLAARPEVEDYARFRATLQRRRAPWPQWPARQRDGRLAAGDGDPAARRYHLYAQWVTEEQITALARQAAATGSAIYLDLPLGVHPDGYDTWRYRRLFASGCSGGAPPDPFFPRGQNWGFPPLLPAALREDGYRYLRACLHHHLRAAGMLRIDHVMSLHRLFWIPHGFAAADGVYVRYPAEELYAVLTLESHRHRAAIVGENLGTVPGYVNAALARRGIRRLYVLQFAVDPAARPALAAVPADTVAGLNTHDMPTFAAFVRGRDISARRALGLLRRAEVARARADRARVLSALVAALRAGGWLTGRPTARAVLSACLRYLAASPAAAVLINLEDLWLEPEPQNVPGTGSERPNWRRRTRHRLEEITAMRPLARLLRAVDALRRQEAR